MGDLILLWFVPFLILHTAIVLFGYAELNDDEPSAIKRVLRTLLVLIVSAVQGPLLWIGFLFFCWQTGRLEKRSRQRVRG